MFEHPYILLALFLLLTAFVWRNSRYYLRHAYLQSVGSKACRKWVENGFFMMGWILLVLAAADPTWGVTEIERKQPVNKYVLLNDGSGSMVDANKERGIGLRLDVLAKANKSFLNLLDKRSDGSKDLVGAIVFSTDAYVVSYLVDDPQFVFKKLDMINYQVSPLGGATNINLAIWAGLEMLIFGSSDPDGEFNTVRSQMFGAGHDYKRSDVLLAKYKAKAEHSCLIIFTDGDFVDPHGGPKHMSIYKQLRLCKDIGVKVYVISVEYIDPYVLKYTKDTGGYAQSFSSFDENKFQKAYEAVVRSQSQTVVVTEKNVRHSFAKHLGFVAFAFLFLCSLSRFTRGRSLTEI